MKKALLLSAMAALFFIATWAWLVSYRTLVPSATKLVSTNEKKMREWRRKQGKEDEEEKDKRPEFPNEFARYERLIRTNLGESAPSYPNNYKMRELAKARAQAVQHARSETAALLPWIERGPNNVGGRTRALLVDPADPASQTWIAGSVGGGIWKTQDAGATWINKTPQLPNLATTTLAMAASNPDVIYAGTGEGFYNADAVNGDGVFKSTDHGETWQQLAATANDINFENINRLLVSPQDENLVLLCANNGTNHIERLSGIFRSNDGGQSWTPVYSSGANRVQQIVANPLNFNTLLATVNGLGVLKSTDAGASWHLSSNGISGVQRVELAIAPSDTSRIYAAVEVNASISDLFLSEDGGGKWTRVNEVVGDNPNWLNGQGWYDNAISVHPYDANTVYVAGLNISRIDIQTSTQKKVTAIEQNQTGSFLALYNFGGTPGGGVVLGTTIGAKAIGDTDLVSVELRFGPGIGQKAHRFNPSRAAARGSYPYADYAEVPFEVWDVTNTRQLMVSFRDDKDDSTFDLAKYDRTNLPREEIFVHLVPYNANAPDPEIAVRGGVLYKCLYFVWPMLADSATWSPALLPLSNLRIKVEQITILDKKRTTRLTNWYQGEPNPDHPSGVYPFVHADHHNLTMIPLNPASKSFRILDASDGGVAYSEDGGVNWANVFGGYITTQFYGADKAPHLDEYIGGTQDNGTWRSASDGQPNSPWSVDLGGDGFGVSWHYQDANKIIGSIYYADIYRTLNHGQTWSSASEGLRDAGNNAPFITPIAKSKSDPELLFTLGASGVWRSDNFAEDWFLSPIANSIWGYNSISGKVEISLANPRIVWAGFRMSGSNPNVSNLQVSSDYGLAFHATKSYMPVAMGTLTGMATHPQEEATAFVTFSFAHAPKILRTRDLGQIWEDISGFGTQPASDNGFPDVATYCVLVMPHRPQEIWAGTEIGLFISQDEGASWTYADNGLPAVSIWQMRIVDDQVVVATHGRGIWSVTIPELRNVPEPVVTLSPVLRQLAQGPDGRLAIPAGLRSAYDSTRVAISGANEILLPANAIAQDTVLYVPVAQAQTVAVTLTGNAHGMAYSSSTRSARVTPLQAARVSYASNFNGGNSDFTGEGFSLLTPAGFADAAIHTAHPYNNNQTLTYQLAIPIIVANSNAFLRYDDIALVEPGEPDSKFGEEGFYDYVVVEATRDGLVWTPLAPGYDCRHDPDWENAYRNNESGRPALFHKHSINLQENFSAGETILLRFRLFADPLVTGWGWALDNLEIQESLTAVAAGETTPLTFSLLPNYPNPFNPTTQIIYSLATPKPVKLSIYNAAGRLVRILVQNSKQSAGLYRVMWNGKDDAGVSVASGIYLYRLEAADFVMTRKMALIR